MLNMAQSARKNATQWSGVTREEAPRHSREGGNPWDLSKNWTKGTGLQEQQGLHNNDGKMVLEKQCIVCIMANRRNPTLHIEEGLEIDGKRKSTVARPAGNHYRRFYQPNRNGNNSWIPACAGMTELVGGS